MKYPCALISAALAGATAFLAGCSENNQIKILSEKVLALEKASQSPQKSDLEARLLAVEKQLEDNKKEIKTEKLIASSAIFETSTLKDAKLEISPLSIFITTGNQEEGEGSVAKLDSEELYIEDFKSFRSAPYWENGKGVRLGLEDKLGDSPDVRIWHRDRKNDKSLDFKLSESGKQRKEAWFVSPKAKGERGFTVIDGDYGPVLIEPFEIKEIGSEAVLVLKIATASAIPLSGLKAKLRYRVSVSKNNNGDYDQKSVPFLADRKMETGIFYSVSIPLGASKNRIGDYFVVEKLEESGVFTRNAP